MLRYSFQPSLAFDLQTKIITKFSDSMKTAMKLDDELKEIALSSMDDKQLQKWSTPVQFAVVMNKFMYFFASKLKDLQKSRVNYLTYILTIFLSIVLVVHVFAIANFALYKLDSSSFFVAFKPNLLHFYDYSINCFFTSSLNDFYPLSGLARLVYTMEIVAAFGIVVIIFSLIFSVASNKHEEEIYQAIKTIKEKGEDLDSFILQEYKLSTDKAIEELYKLKAGFIKIIYYFAKNIE